AEHSMRDRHFPARGRRFPLPRHTLLEWSTAGRGPVKESFYARGQVGRACHEPREVFGAEISIAPARCPPEEGDREEPRRRRQAGRRAIAAPLPCVRRRYQTRPHRVQRDVPRKLQQVGLLVDQESLVSAFEQVTGTAVAAIESLRVDPVQLPDGAGETSAHGLQQKVVAIAHEAECVAANVEPFHNFFEKSKESPPIAVVVEDRKTTV